MEVKPIKTEIEKQKPVKHQPWCASETKTLTSLPPQRAPCDCKAIEETLKQEAERKSQEFQKRFDTHAQPNKFLEAVTNSFGPDEAVHFEQETWSKIHASINDLVAQEREEIAKLCESKGEKTLSIECEKWGKYFARAIRRRGEKE
jgi:hypothetical protein